MGKQKKEKVVVTEQLQLVGMGLDIDHIPEWWGWRFAGYTTGDGYFSISKDLTCTFGICLRVDDIEILEEVKTMLKSNTAISKPWKAKSPRPGRENEKPFCGWTASRPSYLRWMIIPLFEKYHLFGRKAEDFALWKEAVLIRYSGTHHTPVGRLRLEKLRKELKKLHKGGDD